MSPEQLTSSPRPSSRPWGSQEQLFPAPGGDIRSGPIFLSRRSANALARRAASVATLALIDISGVALGLYVGLVVRELWVGHIPPLWGLLWEAETSWLTFISLVMVLVFWRAGLYAARERRAGFGRVLTSILLAAVLIVAFAIGVGHEFTTYLLVPTTVVFTALFVGVLRASYEAASAELMRIAGVRRRALIVGPETERARLERRLASVGRGIEYEFVDAVDPGRTGEGLRELPGILTARSIHEVIVADPVLSDRALLEVVDLAHRLGVKVRIAPTAVELLTHRAELVPGEGVLLFELRPPAFVGTDWAVKRSFDVAVSASVLLIGLPLWLLIALTVRVSSRGPVLYVDRRVGVGEREFPMLKFRTMYANAADIQGRLEEANDADGALFKLRDDPRVTRVGRLLRRLSLDEVPQLWNILRGEMSLVGPRPLPLRDYRKLEDWHRKRYLVLPGMTGLWQISGRSNLGFDELVRLDFHYLENWSLGLDISILARTIPAVLSRRGAY